ncbi:MAG: PrsW family intramembrane metalloprotease [Ignavibacteria bacterium]|nr:PrsW family intramembrane metalloprotease [Ignavibacteria bacterium]
MLIIASLIASIIPMMIYLIIIWRLDKYEREPFLFVILHFIWGAFGAIFFGILGSLLLGSFTGFNDESIESHTLIQSVLFAPISEEIAKGIFLFFIINSRKFDNITDGLVYGGAIGLGFGMTENFTYFISYGDTLSSWLYLVIIRSVFSAVMHGISTGIFGAFLGYAKFNIKRINIMFPFVGIIIAIFIHGAWNLSVSFNETFLYGFIMMFFLILSYFTLFRISITKERSLIIEELNEEAGNNLIPVEHVKIISSSARFKIGWIKEDIRKQYFRSAIKLAFLKRKKKNSKEHLNIMYDNYIESFRDKIRTLLAQNE